MVVGDSLGIRDARIKGEEEIRNRRAPGADFMRRNIRVLRPTAYAIIGLIVLAALFVVIWILLWI